MNRILLLFFLLLPLSTFANDVVLLSVQAEVVRGHTFRVKTNYILNGTASFQDFEYYLSDDEVLDDTDRYIHGERKYAATSQPGYYYYFSVNLDHEAFTDLNYIIAVVNKEQTYQETDYTNNIATSRIMYEDPFHDLDVHEFETNSLLEQVPGNPVRLIGSLQNSGNIAVVSNFKIFLSADALLDETDEEVFACADVKLYPGSSQMSIIYDHTATHALAGRVYFILKADPGNVHEETDEANNIRVVAFTFNAENYEVAAGATHLNNDYNSAGAPFNFSFSYTNTGTTRSVEAGKKFSVSFYISADPELDANDPLISSAPAAVPAPGTTQTTFQYNVIIPSTFSSNLSVYLFSVIDRESILIMDDKSNNISMQEVYLQPQKAGILIDQGYYGFSPEGGFYEHYLGGFLIKPGAPLNLNLEIKNEGTKAATVPVSYYLSADAVLDSQDALIGQGNFGPVMARKSLSIHDFEILNQFNYPPGHYYLIQVKDPENVVDDIYEDNNITAYPLYCAEVFNAEFSFEFTDVDKTEASPGDAVKLSFYVMKAYNFDESKLYTQIYLSKDNQLDATDILYANLQQGEYGGLSHGIIIPENWQSETLYVITQINGERLIEENFYHNNTAVNLVNIHGIVKPALPPVLAQITAISTPENELITFSASATDEDTPASELQYSLDEGAPAGAAIEAATGSFSWTPTEEQGPASYTFTIMVSDGAQMDEKELTIHVLEANQAPEISSEPLTLIKSGEVYSYQLIAIDADLPANTLTYTAVQLPAWLSFDASTQLLSGTPAGIDVQTHEVVLSVSDGAAAVEQHFTITVEGPTGIINPASESAKLRVYPNPGKGTVVLQANGIEHGKALQAAVYTPEGRKLMSITAPLEEINVQLNTLLEKAKAGVYVLLFSWDNEVHNLRLIRQ